MSKFGQFLREAARAVRNHKHEVADNGLIFLPGSRVFIGGVFTGRYAPPGGEFGEPVFGMRCVYPNRVVDQGLNKLLNLLGGHTSSAALSLAPWSGNVTPPASWTGANWSSLATEFTAYDPAARPPWTTVSTTTKELTNVAALAAATITFNAGGPYTIRGCSLAEASSKGGTTGALIAASRFDADLTGMMGGGKLALQYDLAAIDESDV